MLRYKIRNPEGLFSNGGYHPYFTKEGKEWKTLGQLRQHLNVLLSGARYSSERAFVHTIYANCQIVAYNLVEEDAWPVGREQQITQERIDARELSERQRKGDRLETHERRPTKGSSRSRCR